MSSSFALLIDAVGLGGEVIAGEGIGLGVRAAADVAELATSTLTPEPFRVDVHTG